MVCWFFLVVVVLVFVIVLGFFGECYLELPVGLIPWLFCQKLASSTDICVYMNNCFLITCQEAIIFHCNPSGFN